MVSSNQAILLIYLAITISLTNDFTSPEIKYNTSKDEKAEFYPDKYPETS
jgi:hypothetical protein